MDEPCQYCGSNHDPLFVTACRDRVVAERDHLAKFKAWVHNYLDAKGIPTHPDGVHGAEGCRIGDRLDFVFAELDSLKPKAAAFDAITSAMAALCEQEEGCDPAVEALLDKILELRTLKAELDSLRRLAGELARVADRLVVVVGTTDPLGHAAELLDATNVLIEWGKSRSAAKGC